MPVQIEAGSRRRLAQELRASVGTQRHQRPRQGLRRHLAPRRRPERDRWLTRHLEDVARRTQRERAGGGHPEGAPAVDGAGRDVDRRGKPERAQDRKAEAVVVGVAVVEGDHERARRQLRAALEGIDQLVQRDDPVRALHERHLEPENVDRKADVRGRVEHLVLSVGQRVVAEHDAADPLACEPGQREQPRVKQHALHQRCEAAPALAHRPVSQTTLRSPRASHASARSGARFTTQK